MPFGDEGDLVGVGEAQRQGLAGKTAAEDQYVENAHFWGCLGGLEIEGATIAREIAPAQGGVGLNLRCLYGSSECFGGDLEAHGILGVLRPFWVAMFRFQYSDHERSRN